MQAFTVTKELCGNSVRFDCVNRPNALPFKVTVFGAWINGIKTWRYFKCVPDFNVCDVLVSEITEDQYFEWKQIANDFVWARFKEETQLD